MQKSKKSGFTLVEIMIVVAIIGLLAAIAIPSFVNARTKSQTNACINNLRQISGAKDQYALDKGGTAPTAIGDLVSTYITKTPLPGQRQLHDRRPGHRSVLQRLRSHHLRLTAC
jgi:prepilin-type N-terminal cleavage/methylation domain-containing protein